MAPRWSDLSSQAPRPLVLTEGSGDHHVPSMLGAGHRSGDAQRGPKQMSQMLVRLLVQSCPREGGRPCRAWLPYCPGTFPPLCWGSSGPPLSSGLRALSSWSRGCCAFGPGSVPWAPL